MVLPRCVRASGPKASQRKLTVKKSARVVVRVVKKPWCDDTAAGLKFFECVGNQKRRRVNPFKSLKAGDLCVVVRSKDKKKICAVA